MKYLQLLLLFFIQLHAFSYIVTSKELNENINKKFPIEKDVFLSKAIFSHPSLKIDKKSNLILFACDVSNTAFVLENRKVPVFRIFAKSGIRYDGENLFLKKIQIDKIENEHLSAELEEKFIFASELLLNLYFDKKPIYEIKNASAAMKIANSAVKNVITSDGAIKIIF